MKAKRFFFFKTILLLLLVWVATNVKAQEVMPLLEKTAEDNYPTLQAATLMPPKSVHKTVPIVTANVAIYYVQGTVAYLKIKNVGVATNYFLTHGGQKSSHIVAPNALGEVVIKYLTKRTSYMLWGVVDNIPIPLTEVKTSPDPNGIMVSNTLYEHIVKWQTSTNRLPLDQHIFNCPAVSNYEKTAYLQAFFLDGKELNIEVGDGSITSEYIREMQGMNNPKSLCKCKLTLNFSQLPIPSGGMDQNYQLVGVEWGGVWSQEREVNLYSYGTSAGANKYAQFRNDAQRVNRDEFYFNSTERGQTHTAAFLDYSLVCIFGEDPGKDCGCAKNIDIMYQFDAHLRTNSEIPRCFLCGSKGAFAQIEEVTALTVLNHRTQSMRVVDAARAGAKSDRSFNYNRQFLIELADLAAELLKVSLSNSQIRGTQIDSVKRELQDVMRTPIYSGGSITHAFRANMIDGRYYFQLLPNQPIRVALTSLTKAALGGYTSYDNIAESNTDFALAGVVTHVGVDDKFGPCCTPKIGNWVLGGFYGSPVSRDDLRRKVGQFLNNWSPWPGAVREPFTNIIRIKEDMNVFELNQCAEAVIGEPENFGAGDIATDFKIAVNQEGLQVKAVELSEFKYILSNLLGQVVVSGEGIGNIRAQLPKDANGIYILTLTQNGKTYTTKIFNNK